MAKLSWNAPSERIFETGLDRGVFYPKTPPNPILRGRNLAPNPSAKISVTGYISQNPPVIIVSRDTSWRVDGAVKVAIGPGAGSNDTAVSLGGDVGALRLGFEPGKTYTVSADINTPVALTGTLMAHARKIAAYTRIGAGSYVQSTSPAGPTTGTSRVSITFTVPVGATEAFVRLYNGSSTSGDYVLWDNILVIEGTSTEYFDGDSFDELWSLYSAEWTGTPHNSVSEKYENVGTAVPWNGLISVEESGGESSTAYYIDGQAYMHFPPPKEFSAELTAYTYPDEFGTVMGVDDVIDADGLAIDSQVGQQFGLSYRTLVGNGLEGLAHGYKIHLIYDATVSAPSTSYNTLGDEIDPHKFQWEIQAVPQTIEGYRPSAHFIIDTRKMSTDILAKIEKVLYGDSETAPSLPDPIDLVELLTYGGAIVIVDNGDGTWSAMGSRNDIYLLDEDTFQIDNVEMIDYGDGFFGVTTTPA